MSAGEEEVKKEEKRWDPITPWASTSCFEALQPGTLLPYLRKLGSGEITNGREWLGYFEAWAYVFKKRAFEMGWSR
jgi:hypothetical protein